MCVERLRQIRAGEEILVNYDYDINEPPNDYPWYFELKRRIEADEAAEKKRNKKEAKNIKEKKMNCLKSSSNLK